MTYDIYLKWGLRFVIFSGVLISLYTLVMNRSLWHDAAALALYFLSKSYSELLRPLDSNQVAPIGFLFIEKTFVLLFGDYDYALRLFPFISFLVSIPLFYSLSNKITRSKTIALLACGVYSINLRMIYYSSEVKQYTTDVLIGMVIIYTAFYYHANRNKYSLIYYSIIGAVSIWFSNVAIIMLFVIGLYSLYNSFFVGKNVNVLIPIFSWSTSFIIYYALFAHNHPTREMMTNYWQYAFLPLNPFSVGFYEFLYDRVLLSIFSRSLELGKFWIFGAVATLAGCIFLVKEKKIPVVYLLLAPLTIHLLFSSLKLYPFGLRFYLYAFPTIILLYVVGLHRLWSFINDHLIKIPNTLLLFPVLVFYYPLSKGLPLEKQEIKESMEFLSKNIEKGDKIYLYNGAIPAFEFYKRYYPELADIGIDYGSEYREDRRRYIEEILELDGEIWLVFSHVYPFGEPTESEEEYIISSLKSDSLPIQAEHITTCSSVYEISIE